MTLTRQIEAHLNALPPEKQGEVLDFILLLQQREAESEQKPGRSLKAHPAFGSWKQRRIDGLLYQNRLRDEWQE